MKKGFLIAMMLLLAVGSIDAQLRGRAPRRQTADRSRYERSRYADVCDIRLREPGSLEKEVGPDKEKQVRLLIVSGNLNDRDLRYIKKLCDRSKVFGADGKEVENYIDIDMLRARINNGGGFFSSTNRDVLTSNLFANCYHLRSIVLPERVRVIDRGAFRNCRDLEDVVLPAGLETLGEEAFASCSELINVYLPDGMTEVGNKAFADCSRMRYIYIPESVYRIGNNAFESTALSDIYLPDRLEYLGANALSGTSIRSLYIPRNTVIGDNALGNMNKCSEIVVDPDNRNYTTINGALYDYNATTLLRYPMQMKGDLIVPNGVRVIAANACNSCNGIGYVELPASLHEIGDYAFAHCKNLREINIPESCTSIGNGAFRETAITSIALPVGISRICSSTFQDCQQLQHIEIPHTVSIIDANAFHDCKSLQEVVIPDNVSTLPKSAFEGCSSLTALDLGNGLQTIGEYTFKKCKSLTSVSMPETLRTIGKNAFSECNLYKVELNEGLIDINSNAFSENQIVEITIPASVRHLGKKILEKNKALSRIVVKGTTPATLDKTSNDKVALVVPAAAVEAYKQAKNWKNYKNITGE